jgi:hypothetical protein
MRCRLETQQGAEDAGSTLIRGERRGPASRAHSCCGRDPQRRAPRDRRSSPEWLHLSALIHWRQPGGEGAATAACEHSGTAWPSELDVCSRCTTCSTGSLRRCATPGREDGLLCGIGGLAAFVGAAVLEVATGQGTPGRRRSTPCNSIVIWNEFCAFESPQPSQRLAKCTSSLPVRVPQTVQYPHKSFCHGGGAHVSAENRSRSCSWGVRPSSTPERAA